MALEPREIAPRHACAAHHQELVLGEPGHGQLRLDAAALVQPVRVHEPAGRDVDIVAADALQLPACVPALDEVLREARLVEQGDPFARRSMLGCGVFEPVLATEAVLVAGFDAVRREPVRPLPARRLAEARPARRKPLVHRRVPNVARGGELTVGVVAVVEQPQGLRHPLLDIGLVALEGEHPAQVVGGEVERRVALVHPLRARLADSARGDDSDGVQAAGDVEVAELGGFAHVELVVVGEALGAAEEAPPAHLPEQGHPLHRIGEDRHELVFHVARKLVEAEVLRNRVEPDGSCIGLERPHQQAAGVLAVVGALVLIAQHRQVARQIGELLGVGVVVLAGVQRNRHSGEAAEVARPQPRRAHHELAGDVARLGPHSGHPSVLGEDARDRYVLDAAHSAAARAFHVGAHHVDGARHSVDLEPRAAQQVVGAHERVEVSDLLGGDDLHAPEAERVVRIGQALELREAVAAVRDGDAADLAEAGRLPGLRLDLRKEVARIGAQPRVGVARPRGAYESRRVPARAGSELPALEEDDVRPSELREVIGDAGAGHATADDHCARALGQCLAHRKFLQDRAGLTRTRDCATPAAEPASLVAGPRCRGVAIPAVGPGHAMDSTSLDRGRVGRRTIRSSEGG